MESNVEYNKIFLDDIYPYFLDKYLTTDTLGKLRDVPYLEESGYTKYDHSKNTAHMMWHFTHDVSKSVFALLHCLNSDDIVSSKELDICLSQDNIDVRGFNDYVILSTISDVDNIFASLYFGSSSYGINDIKNVYYYMNVDDSNKISFDNEESALLFTSMIRDYAVDERAYTRKQIK